MPVEILMVTENINNPGVLADLVASNLRLKIEEAQSVLEEEEPVARLNLVSNLLSRELQLAEMQAKIQNQAKEEMSKSQREYFLREQMKAIKQELGDIDGKSEEADDLKGKIEAAGMPEEVKKEAEKQLRRLEGMHPDSAESSVVRTYLDWMVELPWKKETKDNIQHRKGEGDPRRGPPRPREGQGADPRIPVRPQAEGQDEGADPLLRRSPGRRENVPRASRSPARWGGSSSACPWAASGTRRRSADTAGRTWARFPGGSSRG